MDHTSRALTDRLTDTIARPGNGSGLHFVFVIRIADLDHIALRAGLDYAFSFLEEMASQLRRQLQEKDSVFRLSERDLGVVLPNMVDAALIPVVCHKINRAFSSYFEALPATSPIRMHIGVATYPDHGQDPEQVLRRAFTAMLGAVRNGVELLQYCEETGKGIHRELDIERELGQAIVNDEFQLAFQPQLDLLSGKLSGAEVLVRWNNARLGQISPSLFIPIAETTGAITEITEWVIQKALNAFHAHRFGDRGFNLGINMPPSTLRDRSFPEFLEQCLELWQVTPGLVTLELTEGAMIDDPKQALAMLTTLKRLGVKLSIDDFGTGYSSLQYLSKLPIDELKIDQSFLRDAGVWQSNQKIIRAIVSLAENFNLEVVAEGVENQDARDFLKTVGCHKAQGYLISRPVPEESLIQMLAVQHGGGGASTARRRKCRTR